MKSSGFGCDVRIKIKYVMECEDLKKKKRGAVFLRVLFVIVCFYTAKIHR